MVSKNDSLVGGADDVAVAVAVAVAVVAIATIGGPSTAGAVLFDTNLGRTLPWLLTTSLFRSGDPGGDDG
jgi:hypothetical protein